MNARLAAYVFTLIWWAAADAAIALSGERRLNNLVSELIEVSSISKPSQAITFKRSSDGWIIIVSRCQGAGSLRITLDQETSTNPAIVQDAQAQPRIEGMRYVTKGEHTISVKTEGDVALEKLVVRAIPELMHCGLGYDPQIKSYGPYDLEFLKSDILPNITTLIVPNNLKLAQAVVDDWHGQGKKFVGEVGVNSQCKTADEHFKYWSNFYDQAPFLDGIIINEFIVNNPVARPGGSISPERRARMEQERQQHEVYAESIRKLHADDRYRNKLVYAYIGGSGKKLNQEIIGTNFIRTIIDCGYRVALERYLHEMSSEKGSTEALQTFVDGIADWEAKEPGVKKQMVIAFGLFSMPPGGLNKQPNVDYHVWMDQQMNAVANHPDLSEIGGLEWWTSLLADEETVRFVGKLYRHYAIEGKTERLTRDPLFLSHIQNGDFEKGTDGWALHSAEDSTIAVRSFPRYGRIEGRFMGLGRPADPEHIGDTFLWMKRSEKGPNTFSQTIRDLEPGRLYSLKMFSCDYDDLIHPKAKKIEEAKPSTGTVLLEGVDVDAKRSFVEVYASTPEPKIPVCITYYWRVFRAKAATAKLTVSDWASDKDSGAGFGQEQTFNFLEIQPYWE